LTCNSLHSEIKNALCCLLTETTMPGSSGSGGGRGIEDDPAYLRDVEGMLKKEGNITKAEVIRKLMKKYKGTENHSAQAWRNWLNRPPKGRSSASRWDVCENKAKQAAKAARPAKPPIVRTDVAFEESESSDEEALRPDP
jgi:hypothetical protein